MPARINQRVITDRLAWIDRMLLEIRSLPLSTFDTFTQDKRNIWSVESCLRRSLEALLDMGRHILAKAYGRGVTEYKEIARSLGENGVLDPECTGIMVSVDLLWEGCIREKRDLCVSVCTVGRRLCGL